TVRVLLVALMCAGSSLATAQPAPAPPPANGADALQAEAEALATAGKYVDAAAKYREAYAIDSRADLLCNVGVAYYKADDRPRADLYLGQCLTQSGSLDAGFAAQVRTVLGVGD